MASISMGTWTGIYDWSLIHERAVRQMIRFECLAASLQSKINCNMLQEWLLARKRAWDRGRGGKGGRLSDSLINKLITQQEIRPHCGHAHPPPAVRKDNQLERKRERERQRMKLFGAELTGKPHESVFGQPTKPKRSASVKFVWKCVDNKWRWLFRRKRVANWDRDTRYMAYIYTHPQSPINLVRNWRTHSEAETKSANLFLPQFDKWKIGDKVQICLLYIYMHIHICHMICVVRSFFLFRHFCSTFGNCSESAFIRLTTLCRCLFRTWITEWMRECMSEWLHDGMNGMNSRLCAFKCN